MKTFLLCVFVLLSGFSLQSTALALELELPIKVADVGYVAYGLAPFGYHVSEHRYDGHPGLDFEFIPGTKALAGHAGRTRWTSDVHTPTLKTLTIEFTDQGKNYQLFYTNMAAIEPGAEEGATVAVGQVVGTPGTINANINGRSVSYAMVHYQLSDLSLDYGLTNTSSRSPEPYFTAAAQAALRAIWAKSAFSQMICEPYLSSPRGLFANPVVTRSWSRTTGGHAQRIDFRCDYAYVAAPGTSAQGYAYTLFDSSGAAVETGTVTVQAQANGTSSIDLTTDSGRVRKGLITVKDNAMRLDYSGMDGSRPTALGANASAYVTGVGATACAKGNDVVCFTGIDSPYPANSVVSAEVAIGWNQLPARNSVADLWVALELPDNRLLYANEQATWAATPAPYRTGLTGSTQNVPVAGLASIVNGVGKYTLRAVLAQPGVHATDTSPALLSNIAAAQINVTAAPASPFSITSDCMFNWAERTYPQYFAPASPISQTNTPYYFRHYASTGNFLATSLGASLYVLGPISGNVLLEVGSLAAIQAAAACF